MVSNELRTGDRHLALVPPEACAAEIPRRSDGVGRALRVLCPACHTALPDDMLLLIRQLDALTNGVSGRD